MFGKVIEKQLVYIAGSGRSGSTMLDMILCGHSQISALGESHRLYVNAAKSYKAHNCTCGHPVGECRFWLRVAKELAKMSGVPSSDVFTTFVTTDPRYLELPADDSGLNIKENVPPKLYQLTGSRVSAVLRSRWGYQILSKIFPDARRHRIVVDNSLMVFEAVRRAWATPVIVDSTKTPVRMKALFFQSQEKFRVLYLIRDGRAVSFARMGRQGLSMEQCARIWTAEHQKIRLALRGIPKEAIHKVIYEDLCVQPEVQIASICNFLGLNFESDMLSFRDNDTHGLGGNPMRWRKSDVNIRIHETWKKKISKRDLETFERIGGDLNKSFGYSAHSF